MFKSFGISVFVLACLLLSACGGDETRTTATPPVNPQQQQPNYNNGAGQYPGQPGFQGQNPGACDECGCWDDGGWGGGWSWNWSFGDRQNANVADCGFDYDDYDDYWY